MNKEVTSDVFVHLHVLYTSWQCLLTFLFLTPSSPNPDPHLAFKLRIVCTMVNTRQNHGMRCGKGKYSQTCMRGGSKRSTHVDFARTHGSSINMGRFHGKKAKNWSGVAPEKMPSPRIELGIFALIDPVMLAYKCDALPLRHEGLWINAESCSLTSYIGLQTCPKILTSTTRSRMHLPLRNRTAKKKQKKCLGLKTEASHSGPSTSG